MTTTNTALPPINTVEEYIRQIGKWIIEVDQVYNAMDKGALSDWHDMKVNANYIGTYNRFAASCRDGKPLIIGAVEGDYEEALDSCFNKIESIEHGILWKGKALGEGAEELKKRIEMIELTAISIAQRLKEFGNLY